MSHEAPPSLMDVLAWSRELSIYIVERDASSARTRPMLEAIGKLTMLARLALEVPNADQLRHAIYNDPYCHAAFSLGRKLEAEERDVVRQLRL